MKKLVILMGILAILTGCQEKKDNPEEKTSSKTTTSLKTSIMTSDNTTDTTNKVDEDQKITTNTITTNTTKESNEKTTKTSGANNPAKSTTKKTTSKTTKKASKSTTTTKKKATTTTKKATTASKLTEKEVYNKMVALKSKYPDGTPWDNSKCYEWKGGQFSKGCGCAGFAFTLSDAAFGSAKAKKHNDISKIRVGDILRLYGDTHSVIVLAVDKSGVTVAEGNMTITGVFENGVYWGRKISTDELKSSTNYIFTRW